MSKKQSKINLANVETDLSDVMNALSGSPLPEVQDQQDTKQQVNQPKKPATSTSASTIPEPKTFSRRKSPSSSPQVKPPLTTTGGALTSEQLDWLFTSSPRENGTTQVRVSKRTKEAVYLLAQHHGGIPGGQLFDNIITYFLTNNIKELKKITRRDPLNQF